MALSDALPAVLAGQSANVGYNDERNAGFRLALRLAGMTIRRGVVIGARERHPGV